MTDTFHYPWDIPPAPNRVPPSDLPPVKAKRRGRRPASVRRAVSLTPGTTPDWLFHHLTINGPATAVEAFAAGARGAGVTPWQLDFADIEDEVFVRAVAQPAGRRTLTVAGCRILARQFRERVEAHQARAAALVGHSLACPFDLHVLLPVPEAILQLGPTHPTALAWLQTHRGISDRLRQVATREKPTTGRRLPRGHAVIGYSFFTHGETPHPAAGDTLADAALFARAASGRLSRVGMDGIADADGALPGGESSAFPHAEPVADGSEEGEGASPFLTLDGFTGPLAHLLTLARAHQIDLADISLAALVDQLTAVLRQAPAAIPLAQKGDWVVMAAWLVQLRARLLLPADAPAQQDAAAEADQLHDRLMALQPVQALAGWLQRQPQLGHEVFARGQPEVFGISTDAGPAIDVIAFLWASLALFDDDATVPETTPVYRPLHLDLYAVAEARGRILRRLPERPDGETLDRFLPDPSKVAESESRYPLRQHSA